MNLRDWPRRYDNSISFSSPYHLGTVSGLLPLAKEAKQFKWDFLSKQRLSKLRRKICSHMLALPESFPVPHALSSHFRSSVPLAGARRMRIVEAARRP